MATAEQYAEWIVKNQDKIGSPEFETVAAAYKLARSSVKTLPGQIPTNPDVDRAPAAIVDEPLTSELMRGLRHGNGLAIRSLASAAIGIPAMMADAVTGVANQFLPEGKRFKAQGPAVQELLTRMGVPEPVNETERFATDLAASATGAAGASKAATYSANQFIKALANNPMQQVRAAVSGTAAGELAKQNDADPITQFIASVGGSFIPTVTGAAVRQLGGRNLFEGGRADTKGRLLNKAAGLQRDEVLTALDENKNFVHGEQPTSAQAASVANSPTFAGVEKQVSSKYGANRMAVRNADNASARLDAVRSIGKDEAALNAAVDARSSNAATNYGEAFKGLIENDSTFANLMSRPSMKAAVGRAAQLAAEKNKTFVIGKTTPESSVEVVNTVDGVPTISTKIVPAESAKFPVQSLHMVKKALDDVIAQPERFVGIGESERAAALATRSEFLNWLKGKSKAYEVARSMFAKDSVPINHMNVGQYLENKLTSPLSDDIQRPAVFAQAMEDAPGTIKRSTGGGPRYNKLTDVLTEQQAGLLGNVKNSLEREAVTKAQGIAGSQSAKDLIGIELGGVDLPNWLSKSVTLARYALEHIGVSTMHKTLEELAKDLQDPTTAAKLMRSATPGQIEAITQVIKAGTPAGLMGAVQATQERQE